MSFVLDNFNELTVDTALASHTPDTGGAWTVGSSNWTVRFLTDELGCDGREFAWNAATPPSADYTVEVNGRTNNTVTTHQFGCCGRSTAFARANASANRYWCYVDGSGVCFILKEIAGASTQIGSTYTIPSFSTTTYYSIKLGMSGSTITLSVNGVQQLSNTDTAITAANLAGLYFRNTDPRITSVDAVDTAAGATIAIGLTAINITGLAESLMTQLSIGVGSFAITGRTLSLVHNVVLPISVGSVAVLGLSPSLRQSLNIAVGSFAVQGLSATLSSAVPLQVGSLVVNGLSQSLQQSVLLPIGVSNVAVSSAAISLSTVLALSTPATVSVNGFAPNPTFSAQTISIGSGSIALTGRAPTVVVSGIGIQQATVVVSGLPVSIANQIPIGRADVLAQGFVPALNHATSINVGQLVVTGRVPTLQTSVSNVAIGTGAMSVSRYAQTLITGTPIINMVTGTMIITGLVPVIGQLLLIRNTGGRADNSLLSKRSDNSLSSRRSDVTRNSRRTST